MLELYLGSDIEYFLQVFTNKPTEFDTVLKTINMYIEINLHDFHFLLDFFDEI